VRAGQLERNRDRTERDARSRGRKVIIVNPYSALVGPGHGRRVEGSQPVSVGSQLQTLLLSFPVKSARRCGLGGHRCAATTKYLAGGGRGLAGYLLAIPCHCDSCRVGGAATRRPTVRSYLAPPTSSGRLQPLRQGWVS